MKYIVVLITAPKKHSKKIASYLVKNKLVACVNIVENINSIYWWQGKICEDREALLVVKTSNEIFKKIVIEVKKVHPYAVPEIIALPIVDGNEEYINWIKQTINR